MSEIKRPRAPRRRQTEVDEARQEKNVWKDRALAAEADVKPWRMRAMAAEAKLDAPRGTEITIPAYAIARLVEAAIAEGAGNELAAVIAHIAMLARRQGIDDLVPNGGGGDPRAHE